MSVRKTEMIVIRLTLGEKMRMKHLADYAGVTISQMVKHLVGKEYLRRGLINDPVTEESIRVDALDVLSESR